MATRAPKPVPEGMHTMTTQLWFNGNCQQALEFYQKAFDAKLVGDVAQSPNGKTIMHAMIKIGDSNVMLADTMSDGWETGPIRSTTASIFLYVEDCDKVYNQALKVGCTVIHEMMDAFWGDRMGHIKDPFGHTWSIATLKWILTREEIAKGQEEWMKSFAQ